MSDKPINTIEVITAYEVEGGSGINFPAIRLSYFLDWSNKREQEIEKLKLELQKANNQNRELEMHLYAAQLQLAK